MKTQIVIGLAALGLLACEEAAQDALPQLIADAGELLQDAGQVLADAATQLHDASTADAQVADASTDKPSRQTVTSACDQVRTIVRGSVTEPSTQLLTYAVFSVSADELRSAWVCEPPVDSDQLACPKGATCTGASPGASRCVNANVIEAEDGRLWVPCAGYKSAKLVRD